MRLIDADAQDFLTEMRSKQEACKKLIAEADGKRKTWTAKDHWEGVYGVFVELALVVKAQPTIDAEPVRRGKWLPHPTDRDYDVCSACGSGTRKRTHGYENGLRWDAEEVFQYCPRCGAKMEM